MSGGKLSVRLIDSPVYVCGSQSDIKWISNWCPSKNSLRPLEILTDTCGFSVVSVRGVAGLHEGEGSTWINLRTKREDTSSGTYEFFA